MATGSSDMMLAKIEKYWSDSGDLEYNAPGLSRSALLIVASPEVRSSVIGRSYRFRLLGANGMGARSAA
jgi:hypothetical protein